MVFENGCLRAVRFFLSLVFDLFKNISLVGTENDLVCQMAQVDDFCSCSRVFRPPPSCLPHAPLCNVSHTK